jgi:uncharacterized damage-inducible protein DinB
MPNHMTAVAAAATLAALVATPLMAQTLPAQPNPLVDSIQDGAKHVRHVFTVAAELMSEEDYVFKPTPEVRSFGQLLAHVADTNYLFCSTATGQQAPVSGTESTRTTRAEIQKVLAESFEYCNGAYAAMADDAKANVMVDFRGKPRSAVAVLNFRNYHSLLHWGNAITYMRLRGKVPPST